MAEQVNTLPISTPGEIGIDPIEQGLRLDTLVRVRWVAIICQSATLLFVNEILNFPVPKLACGLLIALSIAVNIYSKYTKTRTLRISNNAATLHLTFDVIHLSAMLYFTGGLLNPFSFFLLAPVFISTTTLKRRETLSLGLLVIISASVLVMFHEPLPMHADKTLSINTYYLIGIWASLMSCLVFMGFYAYRVTEESRNLAAALTATELVLAKEQHLSAIDGLAAAAAHELGTPLSTIAVVIKELKREWGDHPELGPDIELLNSQTNRCRNILGKLSSLNSDGGGPMAAVRFTDLVNEIVEPHRDFGIELEINRHASVAEQEDIPLVKRLPGVLYGLGNILENAVDFAHSKVDITIAWDDDAILIKIEDDGPGFSETVAARLGEPYVTSRAQKSRRKNHPIEGGGLGLGIFIAKTLIERSGAKIEFSNRTGSTRGANVTVLWPPEALLFKSKTNSAMETVEIPQ
ncbi:MAG: ActS/PrrB/RegB family redox-sensitive histidine kinase [Hyphomicrobiales bacterium]